MGKKDERKKKKARKAAKKDEKKDKKKRKQKKKAEKKKAKKDRKRKNNRKANTARNTTSTSSSCMNATCINNAVTYMKQLKLAVKNFGKQYNRISTFGKQSSGKAGKYDEFEPYLIKLRETGGGNASNMTCNGEKNQGATNLQTLYDNLETCKTIINNTCNANMPAVNMTFMDACKATMDGFVNETDKAIKATGAAACVIWESDLLANMSAMLKDCSLKEHESAHTSAKKACTGNFSFCRQEDDKVSKLVSACSASNSVAKVTAAIAQGTKNQAAATAVSAKVNATLEANRRLRREDTTAAAATTATTATTAAATTAALTTAAANTVYTCADFATKVTEVSIHVTDSPLLATLETILTELANATVATCTDADKSSLGNASTTFLSSTESITLAIAEKQSALNISTGTTVSVADITTVAATTVNTTAAATAANATTAADATTADDATTAAATTAAATTA